MSIAPATQFRKSWLIWSGIGISLFGCAPILVLVGSYFLFRKDVPVGPSGIWCLLWTALGAGLVLLGTIRTLYWKLKMRNNNG